MTKNDRVSLVNGTKGNFSSEPGDSPACRYTETYLDKLGEEWHAGHLYKELWALEPNFDITH